jgi:hypothetical protein
MSISEHFRYRNDVFQSDIFVSDIGITDVDVGCRMSDIADIEIDVDSHLCVYQASVSSFFLYRWRGRPPYAGGIEDKSGGLFNVSSAG